MYQYHFSHEEKMENSMDAIKVNENSPIETVENLIAQMTLEQKIAQLQCCLKFETELGYRLSSAVQGLQKLFFQIYKPAGREPDGEQLYS